MSSSRLRIVVTGLIAQHPRLGGVAWDYLQYAVGLARLGHDVYYLEDSGEWPYTADGGASGHDWIAHDPTPNVKHLMDVMARFGLAERWAYRFPIRPRWFGLPPRQRRAVIDSADLLLNVSGTLKRPEEYRGARRLVYVDSDPVFTQIKLAVPRRHLKFKKRVRAHDVFFSFGEAFSTAMPENGIIQWKPTRQPVLLSEWRHSLPARDVFSTVMSWTSYRPLRYRGRRYGQKDMELRRFLDLPARVAPVTLEVALSRTQHAEWQTDDESETLAAGTPRELLSRMGWRVVDASEVCSDLDAYREYVQSSAAEWSVAKNGYVQGQAGWFSCRSACYLAAGRPVVVQDTGFGPVLPTGEGIVPFRSLEGAVAAIEAVESDYVRHAKAARAIADEYFDSDRVLTRLLEDALTDHVGAGREPAADGRT